MDTKHYLKKKVVDTYNEDRFERANYVKKMLYLIELGFVAKYAKGSILDCGSGLGRFSFLPLYQGFDISEKMISQAKKQHPNKVFWKGNIFKISFDDNTFDTVIAFRLFMHLGKRWKKAFDQCMRVLKPGGHLIMDIKTPLCNIGKKIKIQTISLNELPKPSVILDYPPFLPLTKFLIITKQ